jgi:hypothetical protein
MRGLCALLLASIALQGCSAWNKVAPPKDGYATKPTQRSRLTLDDQSRLEVYGLSVDGDTLRFTPGKATGRADPRPLDSAAASCSTAGHARRRP